MRLQHAMLAAEMALAEAAVADDALRRVLAVLGAAADFLRGAAAEGQGDVEGAVARDVVGGQELGRGEVFAGVDEAEGVRGGEVGAEGDEGEEGSDGGRGGDWDWEGCCGYD